MAKLRLKCPHCGHVFDTTNNPVACPKCNKGVVASNEAMIQIYRMGSPVGMAVGYGTYINGAPCGHIGNRESVLIPVPYGTYNLHFTCGMTRRCNDLQVTLTPENNVAYVKASIKMGFWTNTITAESSTKEEMPPLD